MSIIITKNLEKGIDIFGRRKRLFEADREAKD